MKWLSRSHVWRKCCFNKGLTELPCQLIHLAASLQMLGKVLYLGQIFSAHYYPRDSYVRCPNSCMYTYFREKR